MGSRIVSVERALAEFSRLNVAAAQIRTGSVCIGAVVRKAVTVTSPKEIGKPRMQATAMRSRRASRRKARLDHERAGQRHQQLLAAGQMRGAAIRHCRQPDHVEGRGGAARRVVARHAPHLEPEVDIAGDRLVR